MYITNTASAIARHNHLGPISKRRTAFARDAVFAEFRPRDARALDRDDFVDRRPEQAPRLLANQHDRTAAAMSGVPGTQVPSPAASNLVAFS